MCCRFCVATCNGLTYADNDVFKYLCIDLYKMLGFYDKVATLCYSVSPIKWVKSVKNFFSKLRKMTQINIPAARMDPQCSFIAKIKHTVMGSMPAPHIVILSSALFAWIT